MKVILYIHIIIIALGCSLQAHQAVGYEYEGSVNIGSYEVSASLHEERIGWNGGESGGAYVGFHINNHTIINLKLQYLAVITLLLLLVLILLGTVKRSKTLASSPVPDRDRSFFTKKGNREG